MVSDPGVAGYELYIHAGRSLYDKDKWCDNVVACCILMEKEMAKRLNLILNAVVIVAILLVGTSSAFATTTVIGYVNQPNNDFRPATYKIFVTGKTSDIDSGSCQYTGSPNLYTASYLVDLDNLHVSPALANGDACVLIFEKEDNAGTATHKGYYAVNSQLISLGSDYDVTWSDRNAVPRPTGVSSSGQVALSWAAAVDDGSGNILGYNLYRDTDPAMAGATKVNGSLILVGTTNYTDTTVTNGNLYFYAIKIVFRGTVATPQIESYMSETSNGCTPPLNDTTPPDTSSAYVNDGLGADIDTQFTASSISANWGGFVDPQTNIRYYEYAVGTTSGGTDVVGWTNVGVATSVTNSSVTLTNGQIYYVSVRATNNALLVSSVVTSDGVTVNVDSTPPVTTSAYVNDGLTPPDIDFQSSLNTLSANWGGFSDPQSGIAEYRYAIGTTMGGTDVVGWTSVGTSTNFTLGGLTLTLNTRYYVTVRAFNGGGLSSDLSSDGVAPVNTAGDAPNYPNPFNPGTGSTKIVVDVPGPMDIGVYIYDITARLMYRNVILGANGLTEIIWDGKSYYGQVVDNGVYLVRVIDEHSKQMIAKGKLLVIKR